MRTGGRDGVPGGESRPLLVLDSIIIAAETISNNQSILHSFVNILLTHVATSQYLLMRAQSVHVTSLWSAVW